MVKLKWKGKKKTSHSHNGGMRSRDEGKAVSKYLNIKPAGTLPFLQLQTKEDARVKKKVNNRALLLEVEIPEQRGNVHLTEVV